VIRSNNLSSIIIYLTKNVTKKIIIINKKNKPNSGPAPLQREKAQTKQKAINKHFIYKVVKSFKEIIVSFESKCAFKL
jgi:hypothetical protein